VNRIDRLLEVLRKPSRHVVGLMSGTSVDAIDVVLVEIEGYAAEAIVRQIAFDSFPFPREVRSKVFEQFKPSSSSVEQICFLDFLLGELFAESILATLSHHAVPVESIDLIGTVGQTLWHDPTTVERITSVEWIEHPIITRSTLAIGQSAVIAERTGVITIGDLRVRDVAAGGQGAPLVAYADWALLRHPDKGRCIQNIGGIGNVTWLPAGAELSQVVAFDTGPGNMIIDALAEVATGGQQSYDVDGKIAASGSVREDLLEIWLSDPYFSKPPPKTTGRERFGLHFAKRMITEASQVPLEDLLATATALTARSIASAYRDFIEPLGHIDQVVVGGGGADNPVLMRFLGSLLPGKELLRHEDLVIDSRAKEAIAIALIANDSLAGMPTNVPGATGGRPTVLGKINL
jgi:anhydro-N-acetylmuramic acid kinase